MIANQEVESAKRKALSLAAVRPTDGQFRNGRCAALIKTCYQNDEGNRDNGVTALADPGEGKDGVGACLL